MLEEYLKFVIDQYKFADSELSPLPYSQKYWFKKSITSTKEKRFKAIFNKDSFETAIGNMGGGWGRHPFDSFSRKKKEYAQDVQEWESQFGSSQTENKTPTKAQRAMLALGNALKKLPRMVSSIKTFAVVIDTGKTGAPSFFGGLLLPIEKTKTSRDGLLSDDLESSLKDAQIKLKYEVKGLLKNVPKKSFWFNEKWRTDQWAEERGYEKIEGRSADLAAHVKIKIERIKYYQALRGAPCGIYAYTVGTGVKQENYWRTPDGLTEKLLAVLHAALPGHGLILIGGADKITERSLTLHDIKTMVEEIFKKEPCKFLNRPEIEECTDHVTVRFDTQRAVDIFIIKTEMDLNNLLTEKFSTSLFKVLPYFVKKRVLDRPPLLLRLHKIGIAILFLLIALGCADTAFQARTGYSALGLQFIPICDNSDFSCTYTTSIHFRPSSSPLEIHKIPVPIIFSTFLYSYFSETLEARRVKFFDRPEVIDRFRMNLRKYIYIRNEYRIKNLNMPVFIVQDAYCYDDRLREFSKCLRINYSIPDTHRSGFGALPLQTFRNVLKFKSYEKLKNTAPQLASFFDLYFEACNS